MTQDIYELIFRGIKAKYPGQPIGPRWRSICDTLDGGEGSGNFGHEGRPGKVGGSGEGVGEKGAEEQKSKHKLELKISTKSKAVSILKGTEISGNSIEERIESAWDFWDENFAGAEEKRDDLGKIKFFNSSAKEILGKNVNDGKLDLFPALRAIVKNGILIGRKTLSVPKENGISKFYYIQAKIEVNGKERYAQVDIGERKDGKRLYYLNEIKN